MIEALLTELGNICKLMGGEVVSMEAPLEDGLYMVKIQMKFPGKSVTMTHQFPREAEKDNFFIQQAIVNFMTTITERRRIGSNVKAEAITDPNPISRR